MKKGVFYLMLLGFSNLLGQYSQDFEGWSYHSQGNWSVTDHTGTYTTGGTYLNFGFSVSGYLKLGFNNQGDFMEFPPVPNPGEIIFMARISSPGSATLQVQVFDNGSWIPSHEISITETNYSQYKVAVSSNDNTPLPLRLVMTEFNEQSIFFDDFSAVQSVLLPVALNDFSSASTSQGIFVNWSTSREIENDYFTLQRSSNKTDFEDIALIEGQKHSERYTNYQFMDHTPKMGKNYYRLKQTDIGGAVHFSNIIETNFLPQQKPLVVYPTVAKDLINIVTNSQFSNNSRVYIVDQWGRRWLQNEIPKGIHTTSININHLPSGRYFLQWENSFGSEVKSFFKS